MIFVRPWWDTAKIAVLALLFLFQNTMLPIALANLPAPVFQVTYQLKLVATAICSVLLLPNRKYSVQQWLCLLALSGGVAVVILSEEQQKGQPSDNDSSVASLSVGLLCVVLSSISSALAGVYFELVLKKKKPKKETTATGTTTNNTESNDKQANVSLWMRNIQLSAFTIVFVLIQNIINQDIEETGDLPYLYGFGAEAWALVALQAGGGLLVAAVIKHADNVLKGLATAVSVVLSTICSAQLFNTHLTGSFCTGAGVILLAVYVFNVGIPTGWMAPTNNTPVDRVLTTNNVSNDATTQTKEDR